MHMAPGKAGSEQTDIFPFSVYFSEFDTICSMTNATHFSSPIRKSLRAAVLKRNSLFDKQAAGIF